MVKNRVHFHHFPGHTHGPGCECEERASEVKMAKDQSVGLLELFGERMEEQRALLADAMDDIDDQAVRGLLAESSFFLGKSSAKLNDALSALKTT